MDMETYEKVKEEYKVLRKYKEMIGSIEPEFFFNFIDKLLDEISDLENKIKCR